MNKKIFKRSFLASLGRLIGVVLGASAGSMLKDLVMNQAQGWSLAVTMTVVSFVLIWVSEYNRELMY